jgi:integrase
MAWEATKVQFLLRNSDSGRYYARLYRGGKESWKSLKTKVFSVAEARLAKEINDAKKVSKTERTVENGKATVENIADRYLESVRRAVDIKPSTVKYREEIVTSIFKTWPELKGLQPKAVTSKQCEEWAKSHSTKYSGTRFNNAIDTLRLIFVSAIEAGYIYRNPASELAKRPPSKKRLALPSHEEFRKLVTNMRDAGGWCSVQAGDLVEFLAYSGCRITEASHVKWADIETESIWLHGDPVHGTKGGESRQIPIIGPMATLLKDLQTNPRYVRDEERVGYVLAITECQKALTRACDEIKIKRITHHDLRHLFATRCIEAGVDIPTVSRWLGHKDGGALAMKTYGHLRMEHSKAKAAKVTF